MSLDLSSNFPQFNFDMRNVNGHSIYEFEGFVLDVDKLMLYRNEVELSLPPKVIKTLSVLVENRGEILSKEELMERVWEDSVVEESNLSQYLYLLRKTVGNRPDGTPYIETLRRRGYRFTGDVVVRTDPQPQAVPRSSLRPTLIGRGEEVDEVISLLDSDETRMLTVSGVGGVGKTTLARAVSAEWTGSDETIFVELAAARRPEHVVSAIASAFGLKESAGKPLINDLKDHLRLRSCLLVLDNFEQVAEAAGMLQDLVITTSLRLKLLVTSRVPLRVVSESLYSLRPLEIPSRASNDLEKIAKCESVALFAERAKIVQPEFELTNDNANVIAEICTRLGGLPLAIELAAARTKLMSPEAVRTRLIRQLSILTGGPTEAPKRQQTMRETIAWSFDLLADSEKAIFARLGVFSGGFDLEAAESVCADLAGPADGTVLDSISSLVEQNLLVVRTDKDGAPRIHMLEVLREFAVEALILSDEFEKAGRAHAGYYLDLAESAEPQLVAARSATWLEKLEKEHDNLRAALAWSKAHDPGIGQRMAGAVWRFWWLHGHVREACEQLGEFLDGTTTIEPQVRAKMLSGGSFLTRLAGDPGRSKSYAEQGVELSESNGDLRNAALAYNQLGFLALDIGQLPEAERMFFRGLEKAEALGDIQILALLNNGLGELSRSKGEYDRAAEFYGRALGFNREAGDRVRQTTCLINLGATSLMLGDRDVAASCYRSGLEISSEMKDMNGTLYCLEGLAGSYWALRDQERAALLFGAASTGRLKNSLLLEAADKEPYDRSVSLVREALGEARWEASFSQGSKLGLEDAADLALEDRGKFERRNEQDAGPELARQTVQGKQILEESGRPSVSVSEEVEIRTVAGSKWTRSYPMLLATFAFIGIVSVGILAYFKLSRTPSSAETDMQREITVTRLTNSSYVWGASLSPDGNYFAYSEIDTEESRLFVQQTGENSRIELYSISGSTIGGTTFTPDGRWIYFLGAREGEPARLFRIPTIGGTPTQILSGNISTVSFSPDGKEMAFTRSNGPNSTSIMITDKDGRSERELVHREGLVTVGSNSAWSPDGSKLVFAETDRTHTPVASRLRLVDTSSGSVSRFSDELWVVVNRIEWVPDGSGVVTNATRTADRETPAFHYNLYHISYPDGISRRITNDGNRHDTASLGIAKNGSLLAVPATRACQVWSLKNPGDASTADQLTRGTADGRAGLVSMPDGRIGYTARTAENLTLWMMNADGSGAKQIETGFGFNEELRSDPSGRFLVFSTTQNSSSHHLYRIDPDGGNPKQLTFGNASEIDSTVSPDGTTIVTLSNDTSANPPRSVLKKLPSAGGQPQVLEIENCVSPVFSPDGSMLSCVKDGSEAVIVNSSDGRVIESLKFPPGSVANFGALWMPDSSGLVVITNERRWTSNLTVIPRDRRKPYKLTNFTSGTIYRFAFMHDGNGILLARGYPTQDAVLIRNAF